MPGLCKGGGGVRTRPRVGMSQSASVSRSKIEEYDVGNTDVLFARAA